MFARSFFLVLAVVFFKIHVALSKIYGQGFYVTEFKQDWCRQRKAALDWKAILEPCKRDLEYSVKPRSVKLT